MAKASKPPTLNVTQRPGVSDARLLAEVAVDPTVTAAFLTGQFGKGIVGEQAVTDLVAVMREAAAAVRSGDLSGVETMLMSQAMALNAMFGELARRGGANICEYIPAAERYLRLAMKAQAQCRATLETLAAIKNPPVVYARQANIAAGPQQVNNGGAHPLVGEKPQDAPNGLLEAGHGDGAGERLDLGTAGAPRGGDPALATVGAIDGAAHG